VVPTRGGDAACFQITLGNLVNVDDDDDDDDDYQFV